MNDKKIPSKELQNRLICSKILFIEGVEKIDKGVPFNEGFAILNFQDSVEMFLRVIAEFINANLKHNAAFNHIIDSINNVGDKQLSHTSQLNRLNNARVSFKHLGLEPKNEDVIKFRNDLESFFPVATRAFLNLDYNKLSLINLIGHCRVENFLNKAESHLERGSFDESIIASAIAFEIFIANHEKCNDVYKHQCNLNESPFQFQDNMLSDWSNSVEEALNYQQSVLELLVNNIDYKDYKRYKYITPEICLSDAGTFFINDFRIGVSKIAIYENALFAYKFVVDSILQLKKNSVPFNYNFEFDYTYLKVVNDDNMIVYPENEPEVIRAIKVGEVLKAYTSQINNDKNGYLQILQDGDDAYIKKENAVILD